MLCVHSVQTVGVCVVSRSSSRLFLVDCTGSCMLQRLSHYFVANDIVATEKMQAILLTAVGPALIHARHRSDWTSCNSPSWWTCR